MSNLNTNGAEIREDEFADYQKEVTRTKFFAGINQALTGASFLAVLGIIGNALIQVHTTVAGAPIIGTFANIAAGFAMVNWLPAVALLGVGMLCAYLATSYYQKAQMLDMDFGAKKTAIALGKTSSSPEVEIATQIEKQLAQNKSKPLSPVINMTQNSMGDTTADAPVIALTGPMTTIGNERALADTVIPRAQAKGATDTKSAVDWKTQVEAKNENASLARTA
jgi:hypothetical protein